ncbi:SpoIID/LytB domain-containing protein [Paenibacillus athensensis]|uniref:SPOR domain-containing protein n=1 Tax=Paenibacillus athensensis TaxID=1967502 RepID=A0A4Y8Q0S6_9BACL|nr:SpoIID/LytB domain-containing protein [Paenibacillus athensensis]MCD1258237.1 SpoIID/LytB domain-containing protein [Paenibacillus athensensis]
MPLKTWLPRKSAAFAAAFALIAGTLPAAAPVAHAAHWDTIRVALLMNASKYTLIEPAVTLTASAGLTIGVENGGVFAPLATIAGPAVVRGSLDAYSVMLLETADFAAAKSLYAKLATLPNDGYILSRSKAGKLLYQVYYGSFGSREEADSFKTQALLDPAVASLAQGGALAAISGPLHLAVATYATEAQAQAQIASLALAGLPAELALQLDATGKPVYSVWLGSVSTPQELAALKQQAAPLLQGLPLPQADTSAPYVLRRADVTASASATDAAVAHYAAGGGGQKTLFRTQMGGIAVKEHFARAYRGDLELSAFNNRLALINVLPFEQYLYGVVSSELSASWPSEALKAQAVAARTYAIRQGNKYQIANVTDTTLDQAYNGLSREFDAAVQAVDATKDEVLVDQSGTLITPFYSSNAGGTTADPSEVWGTPIPYLKSVPSPDDGATAGKLPWYRVSLADGRSGYVRSDYLKSTGQKNAAGQLIYESTEAGVNVRPAPYVDNTSNASIYQLSAKERVTVTGQETESNAYSWIRGPYTAAELAAKLSSSGVDLSGGLKTLEVSKRGPSGRVIELKANGQVVKTSNPDALRTLLGSLPSTRFEIEGSGSYTNNAASADTGAAGAAASGVAVASRDASVKAGGDTLFVLSGSGDPPTARKTADLTVLGANGAAQAPVQPPVQTPGGASGQTFVFKGTGFGHGLGMSQWGARGYAELGYDYTRILQAYYYGVTIVKE